MKKILLIHNILWSHYKAVVFTELHTLIKNEGDELFVVHIAPKGIAQKNLGEIELELHQYPYKVIFAEDYEIPSIFRKSVSLWREIAQYNPDLVILPGFGEIPFWVALLAAKFHRIPLILTCDSTAMDRPATWYKNQLKRRFVGSCTAAFSYGSKSKEYLLNLGMASAAVFNRCQAINNSEYSEIHRAALKDRALRIADGKYKVHNFIYVGRLNSIKNVERLIRAFTWLKLSAEKATEWGLIIVGDGPQKQELVGLCEVLQTPDIHFVGGKSWREVPEYHALADVFVLPSISEPWGLVVNEAMLCQLPVLISDRCGAAYDLVKAGENGYMFDPFNEMELREHLRYFVMNPERLERMGAVSLDIIKEFTAKNAARQMHNGIKYALAV